MTETMSDYKVDTASRPQHTRLYLCGPMSGLPGNNHDAFNAAAARLREAGYKVANPAEISGSKLWQWADWMRAAIRLMLTCDAIAVLPGWHDSRGAQVESRLAMQLDIEISTVTAWLMRS